MAAIVGDRPIKVTPVLRINGGDEPVADSYAIPRPVRDHVLVRDRFDVFPYGTCRARSCDLDHTVPFADGESGQTRPSNLGPHSRRAHRGKTHGGWRLEQPRPGVFWWTSPRGQVYRVGADGTTNLTPGDQLADCSDAEHALHWRLDRWRGS
ncbi:MAG: HNH endonuclease [Propionibacteriaceae bacterium]|nr:HNH endonuclease [Propionibacteriaceae bacterium]